MAEPERDTLEEKRTTNPVVGIGVAIGAGLGTVLFAFTQNPVWIGLGAGLGVVAGAILQTTRG